MGLFKTMLLEHLNKLILSNEGLVYDNGCSKIKNSKIIYNAKHFYEHQDGDNIYEDEWIEQNIEKLCTDDLFDELELIYSELDKKVGE